MRQFALWPRRWVFWTTLPFLLPQALWLRRTAPRFAPGDGPTQGLIGDAENDGNDQAPLKMLAIGDSIMAGVGAPRVRDGLPGQVAQALHGRLGRAVAWNAIGQSGLDVSQVRQQLVPKITAEFDLALISVGVNDVTGLTSTKRWRSQLTSLLGDLHQRSPTALIVLCGLPPMHGFPLIPQPLRWVIGQRAKTLDAIAVEVAAQQQQWHYQPTAFEPSPDQFADDGYHPNPTSCRVWASTIVESIEAALQAMGSRLP